MRKKFLLMLTVLVIALGGSGKLFAENGNVAKVGGTEYATIDEAIANWGDKTTLTLLADVTLSDVIQLSSTEMHTLDLSSFTMTAASKKDAIQIVNNGRSSASYALDIKADATNPGGITATGKAVVKTTGKSGVKDRPIIRFYNGVFTGTNVIYHSGSNGTNCPQFQFHGGVFNGTVYANRALIQFYGGTFTGSLRMSVDSSAYALVAGGRFKQLSNLYMSALNKDKFTIGSAKGVFDREVYIDEEGYYVVAKTEPAEGIEADVAKKPGTNDYLAYSKVATEGQLGYTNVETALKNNTSATVTVYAEKVDMTGINFKGTIVVPEGNDITITNAPSTLKVQLADGTVLTPDANGTVATKLEVDKLDELQAALASTTNVPIVITKQIEIPADETVVLDLNGKTVTVVYQEGNTTKHIYALDNYGTLTITDYKGNGSIKARGIFVQDGSKLTVESGSLYGIDSNGGSALYQYGGDIVINGGLVEQQAEGTYNFAINALGGTVTVNDGKIAGNHGAIAAGGAAVVINGGELVCTGTAGMTDNVLYTYDTGEITINGGTFVADNDGPAGGCCVYDANGKATINGGTFSNSSGGDVWGTTGTTIKGGTFENLIETQHIADGYELGADGKVVKKVVAKIGETPYYTLAEALEEAIDGATVTLMNNTTESIAAFSNVNLETTVAAGVTLNNTYTDWIYMNNVTIGNGVTLDMNNVYYNSGVNVIEGTLNAATLYNANNSKTTVQNGGNISTTGMIVNRYHTVADAGIYVYGDNDASTVEVKCENTIGTYSGTFYAKDAVVNGNMLWIDYLKNSTQEGDEYSQSKPIFENSTVNITKELRLYKDATLTLVNSDVTAGTVQIRENATPTVNVDENSTVKATTVQNLAGASMDAVLENGFVSFKTIVAKIGNNKFYTLQAAVNAVQEGETITILAGTISEGTVKLPATLKNVTLKGSSVARSAEGAILEDMTISAADGNSYSYVNLTFDGITFDNSRILLTGWRNGEEVIENLTVTNCIFKNISDNTNTAPVHINKDATEAVKGFTFTNNVIDGATGGSKSGIYAQVTGNVVVENNIINNVSFRPYVIQVTTDDGIADNFVVKGNTFSGSAVGRAQGLGNNAEGTDNVNIVVSNNIFKGITDAQQICYWNFNAAKTTADLSKNYYDIDIEANPSKIYYNAAASNTGDLVKMGVFPIYTELAADGTINTESAYYPPVAKVGENTYATLSAAFAAVTSDTETVIVLRDVTENLTGAYLRGNITTENNAKVTITLTNSDWVYCPYTFVLGENITLNVPALFYYAGGTQINGTLVVNSYYQRYGSTKLTINEPGSMTVTSETCIIRYMDGDPNAGIYVVGDNNDETVGLKLSVAYFYQGMINAKDANIVAGTYWQTNETDGQGSANLVLDNSTLTVTVYDHPAKATGNSTVTLKNNSVFDAKNGGFEYGDNTKLSVDATSKIIGKSGEEVKVPVAKINGEKYYTLESAFKAATSGCTIDIINNVTVDYAWDARYTGAKFTVPVTINGNGNTIKFTNTVYDGGNYMSAFRFEANATVKNLTVDMTEAQSGFATRIRAISAKGNLTVDGCTFLGNGSENNTRAIIFGEGATAIDQISITNSTFKGWKRGISDNESGKDVVAEVTVTDNILTDAAVYVSAKETVTFTGNTVEGAYVDIRSYSADNALNVIAKENDLEQNTASAYNYIKAGGTVDAQEEFKLAPVAKIGNVEYTTLAEAFEAAVEGDVVRLLINTTLAEELTTPAGITIDGNGKQINGTIYAGGNLTFVGHTKVTAFSASYYDRVITIGAEACLEVTGTGRVTLGYGNTFNITGTIDDAKNADKTAVKPSLIIPGGMSITGGNNATMNVTNAYVQIGSTTSKNSAANGTFNMNFTNSIVEFTNQLTFAEPTSGKNPTFNVNIKDCVLTTGTKFIAAAPNSNVVVDNSVVTLGTYFRNSGKFDIVKGSVFTGATIQFGENGGNNGALTVDASKLTINATSTGLALDGKTTGSITLKNGATANIDYIKDMAELYMTADSKLYSKTADLNIQTEPSYKVVYNENDKVYETADATIYVATKAELKNAIENAVDGTFIRMTANIDYGTDQLAITKNINLNLGGNTLTTRNPYGGMSVKGNPTIKNGTIVHASNTAAIKVWNATAFEDLVIDVQGKGDTNKTIGGIVLQSGSTTRVGLIKNVTIKGAALTNGIETYNCGDATENVIGAMENVAINAQGTGMLISAPCGTATNCSISGGTNGIEIWIKGNYSASLNLVGSTVEGGVYAHDEFSSNPGIVNNGTLSLTADEATTGAGVEDVTLTIARAENLKGVVEDVMEAAKAKIGNTYYTTLAKAIAAAQAGDVVTVFEGTYAMPSMKAGITIIGEGNVLFEGTLTGTLENLTMKNIHIKGGNAQRWAYAKGNLLFENVTFEATSVYALHFDGITAGTNLTYKNCTIIGWAALGGTPASCTFEGCTIKGNGTYGLIRTYFNTTIKDCTFDVANVNTNDVYQDGIHAVEGAYVTVNGCTNENGDMIDLVNIHALSIVKLGDVEIKNVVKANDNYYRTLAEAFAAVGVGNGKTVELIRNVDLAGAEWTPVNFNGVFDGQDHTISNLVVNGAGKSNQGFFGTTQKGEIKNVTFNNAKVTGRLNVGVVAGTPYTSKYTNVKVTGHVEVNGMAYVGGVGGKNAYANWTDITVDVDTDSYVKANSVENGTAYRTYVGGVVGFNGEGGHTFKNISSNIKVIGSTCDIGGIFGIAHYNNKFENITFTGSVEAPEGAEEVGGIAGVWHNEVGTSVTFTDCTSTGTVKVGEVETTGSIVGGAYNAANETEENSGSLIIDGVEAWLKVAQVGEVKYLTLAEAVAAVTENTTITMLADVELTSTVTVAKGQDVTLNLNGKTISAAITEQLTKSFAAIQNRGTLTVKDSATTRAAGRITVSYAGTTFGYGIGLYTISNEGGELNIESGIVENTTTVSGSMYDAIDNNSTLGETVLNITGGEVRCPGYIGVRQFANSTTHENIVNVTGGKVVGGNTSIWMQNPISGNPKATIAISGDANIDGRLLAGTSTGFIFDVTGGTFTVDPSDYLSAEFDAIETNGTWVVKQVSGTQTREFTRGWNWFSSYVDLSQQGGLDKLQTALGESGLQIKAQNKNQSVVYQHIGNNIYDWIGDLDLTAGKMYMVNTSAAVSASISGSFVDYENEALLLKSGWNWISYPLNQEVDINTALQNLDATQGDNIKGYGTTSIATYYNGKWVGPLTTLKPGQGYMYQSAKQTSFVYSTEGNTANASKSNVSAEETYWTPSMSEYANNMVVFATLRSGEMSDNYEVAAFANGECRGSARPIYIEQLDQYMLFMTIYGDEVEEMTFKCYDVNNGTEYDLINRMVYSNDAVVGSLDEPYIFTCSTTGIGEATLSDINIYPNPTTTDREINLQATCDKVEVFNTLGVKVAEYQNVDTIDALETAGTYVIRVTLNGDVKHCRLVVK